MVRAERMTLGFVQLSPVLGRTLLVLMVTTSVKCHWPSEASEVVRDWENQLEASMHSVLSDLRESVPAVVGIPDSSAVVGRSFRVTIPTDLIASNGEIIQVRTLNPIISKLLFSFAVPIVSPFLSSMSCCLYFFLKVLGSVPCKSKWLKQL